MANRPRSLEQLEARVKELEHIDIETVCLGNHPAIDAKTLRLRSYASNGKGKKDHTFGSPHLRVGNVVVIEVLKKGVAGGMKATRVEALKALRETLDKATLDEVGRWLKRMRVSKLYKEDHEYRWTYVLQGDVTVPNDVIRNFKLTRAFKEAHLEE